MRCCCNVKGFITSVDIESGKVSAKGEDGKIYNNVQLISPYNTTSIPKIAINMRILLQKSMGSDGVVLGTPYNPITQFQLESEGDYAVGSVEGKNNIIFKVSGDTVENATTKEVNAEEYNINAKTNIKNAEAVNANATVEVVIPSGSSAGTYIGTIKTTGQ